MEICTTARLYEGRSPIFQRVPTLFEKRDSSLLLIDCRHRLPSASEDAVSRTAAAAAAVVAAAVAAAAAEVAALGRLRRVESPLGLTMEARVVFFDDDGEA